MIAEMMIKDEMEQDKHTIDLCSVCGKMFIVAEMSECLVHGYVCMDCDCACPVIDE